MSGYPATRDYLYSLKNRGSKYGIDRMRCFVKALGHPEKRFPVIHVAGTNGKGSVCAMLEAIFRRNGYRTGLYTSPHLIRQGERVQVNRTILQEDDIIRYTEQLKPIAAELAQDDPDGHPSFFEFMTAMAFLRFAEEEVDIALLETGLGGRLDATNVVTPELSIITTISLDHTELLGDSIEAIAREKAGIIKPGKPVLIGWLPCVAAAVVRQIAAEREAPLFVTSERFPDIERLPSTNLNGQFQKRNAAVALYATEILANKYNLEYRRSENALQTIQWSGRWETIQVDDRTIILDASHNPEGVHELERNLIQLNTSLHRPPLIVAASLGEARAQALIPIIATHGRELFLVAPNQDRAIPPETLGLMLQKASETPYQLSSISQIFPAAQRCMIGEPGDTIIITGSLYLIGEVLERITCEELSQENLLQDNP